LKRLQYLFLFLIAIAFLPVQRESGRAVPVTALMEQGPAKPQLVKLADHHVKQRLERFKRRPVGLVEHHEEALAVPAIYLRARFVYINTHYRVYSRSFRSSAIVFGDWRGPPMA
jgi:hypothetical protein